MATSHRNLPGLLCFLLCVFLFAHKAKAQNEVAIGSNTTKSNAILWLNGNGSQGLILPVVPNKSNVSNPDKGMIVYDNADNKVWYRNDTGWVEVGGGSSSTTSLNLNIVGNELQLLNGTTVQSKVNIAGGAPVTDALMGWNGTSWQYTTIGDIGGGQVIGIKGKAVPALPTTTQALVYDGAAWKFQVLTGNTDSQSLTFTSPNLSISNGNSVNLSALDKDAQTLTLSGNNLSITGGNSVTLPSFSGVTSIATGTGLTGGPITTTGTINVDVGTTANKIVQLDGTGKLPAVDGSQLTNLVGDISGVVAGTGLTGGATTGSATLNVDVGTTANKIVQLDGTGKLPAVDGSQLTNLPASIEVGDISDVIAGTGLTGGAAAGSATLNVDVGTTANKIVQLDGTGKLPAIDGSQLTNLPIVAETGDISAVVAGTGLTGGAATGLATLNVDVGTTANKIVQLDGTGKLPAVDGSQLTNLVGDISGVVAGTGLTGGATIGSATLNVDVGTTANKIIQLDGTGKLPAVDGSQLTNLPALVETGDISAVVAGTGLAGGATTGSATLNVDVGTTANKIVQLDGTGKLPAVDGSQLTNLPAFVETGDISAVVAGTGLAGGATTGSATLNVDVGTTANKIVQLDGTGKLPAVDGSQLTNLPAFVETGDISAVVAGTGLTGGAATGSATLNVDVGTTANKIVQLDGTGKLPAVDGSQLTNLPVVAETGDISAVVAGTGMTGGAATGSATLNVDVGTTANKIVQLDGTGKLPAVDGSQLTNLSTGVTSVGLAMPSLFNVTGSPITTTGTLTTSLATQAAATVFAAPTGSVGAPTFRGLVSTDIPNLDAAKITSGALSIANGGTGATTATNALTNLGALGTASTAGGDLSGTFSALQLAAGVIVNADISGSAAIAGSKITPAFGAQNISTTGTLSAGATTVTGLTIGTSVWPTNSAGVLSNNGTGTLSWAASFTNPMTNTGDIIYGGAGGAATRLAGASGFLKSNGTTPSWSAIDLTGADVTGILGVANGGTGRATWDGLLLGTGATISDISTGTAGQILKVMGTTPSWQDFLITSTEITDLSILNADVNTNAAIDGTKINPAFGTQDISTSGDLTITGNAEFSNEVGIISGALPGTSLYVGNGATRSAQFNGDVMVDGSLAIGGTLGVQNDALFAAGNTAGINGQVLTSQGNGVAPIWKDVSVFSILNTIPKGDGSTLAASQIFDDGTNVGISTVTPAARLHVQGPGNFDIANTEGDFKVGNGTHRFKVGVAYAGGGAGDVYMGAQGGTSRLFIGGGASLVDFQTITVGGGNVGIGNTAPSAKLDVTGTVKIVDGTQQAGYVLTSDVNGLASWQSPAAVSGWGTTGNAGITDANFIGPTTSAPFNIKINSVRAGRVDPTNQDTFFGYEGGRDNISGTNSKNTAFGGSALRLNKYGFYNTAIGQGALYNMISTAVASYNANNTAVGFESLYVTNNSTATSVQGVRNTAIGSVSGHDNVTGNENVFVGYNAGVGNISGGNNTFVGFAAAPTTGALNNATAIGNGASVNASNKIVLGNASATTVGGYGAFTNYSDKRLKENIQYSDDLGLNFIMQLKTATYNYKSDINKRHRNGMIAQDVEEIIKKLNVPFSGLIIDDDAERTLNLSYSEFVMPIINSVQEQQKMIDEQKSEIEKLKAQLIEKDDKLNSLDGSVSAMKNELEDIKRVLGIEAKTKTAGKK